MNYERTSMGRDTKCYISVPITGYDLKIVRIWVDTAKDMLERRGYMPISPLDVSSNTEAPYSEHMGKDIAALLKCDTVLFLRGWHDSRGCQLEYEAAKIYNKKIMFE